MTTELIKPQNDFDLALAQVDSIGKLASLLLKAPHYRKIGEDGIYAILFACKSLGVDPFQGLNGAFYYLQGKVGMSTELMASLIRRAGHSIEQDPESGDKVCILKGKRKDNGNEWTISFSVDDAKRAELYKNMYLKYPSVMLYNRAMSMLSRQLFPDVIKGYGYCEDEIDEIADVKNKKNVKLQETIDVKPIDNAVVKEDLTSDRVKPDPTQEFKEKVDELLKLVDLCPAEKKTNFYEIVEAKGWAHPYDMTEKFLEIQTKQAKDYLARIQKESTMKMEGILNEGLPT